jgi:hypothetical protein
MDEHAPRSVGLLRGNVFRGLLLGFALLSLVLVFVSFVARRDYIANATPATVRAATPVAPLPTAWMSTEDGNRADYPVRIEPDAGAPFAQSLFLAKASIEGLQAGKTLRIVYMRDNPRRHEIEGTPPPPIAWGWLLPALLTGGLFAWSLRLR